MEESILKILSTFGWPAALGLAFWAMRPIWAALASRIMKRSDDNSITELLEFKMKAETNHFHDIEDLKREADDLKRDAREVRRDFENFRTEIAGRLARLEAKITNGHQK